MGVPTPLHPRTSALCKSLGWKHWSGYFAVTSYEVLHDSEYQALRHTAGLIDYFPLYKYDLSGPGALDLLNLVMTRSVSKLAVGQVAYSPWCTAEGKVLDDGTIFRLDHDRFRVTAADPAYRWFRTCATGLDVSIEDVSETVGALSLQGPTSRQVLRAAARDIDIDRLRYFRFAPATVGGARVILSRTGYTGDLGYEIWTDAADAVPVWDALMEAGRPWGVTPVGLMGLDMARIEAGFVLKGVDYIGARFGMNADQLYSPFEVGLGWCVNLKKASFIGRQALIAEVRRGSRRKLVGLEIDWCAIERLFESAGLPPQVPSAPWRTAVPVYDPGGDWIGKATSGCWSPILKKNLALATLASARTRPDTEVMIEWTVDGHREAVPARVVPTPFFDPERKRT